MIRRNDRQGDDQQETGAMVNWWLKAVKQGLDFGGRARRREFWLFFLVNLGIQVVLAVIDTLTGSGGFTTTSGPYNVGFYYQAGWLGIIFTLLVLVPGLAVAVRRLHDTGRPAWWLLIALVPVVGAIVLVVFYALDGNRGENRYGADPKTEELSRA
jgi:uncharacterized membrane protein YhaH (DUF805 family)